MEGGWVEAELRIKGPMRELDHSRQAFSWRHRREKSRYLAGCHSNSIDSGQDPGRRKGSRMAQLYEMK